MSLSDKPVISTDDLHFSINDRVIFKGLSLSIPRGKITAIMGPSGTGKTTLLRLIGGQLWADSGKLQVQGVEMNSSLSGRNLQQLRCKMGRLFQQGALFSDLNVFDNVAFPLREHLRLPADMVRDLVLLNLQAVGLRGAASLQVSELSGGMARRVAIARAIVMNPKLMLYDEPFAGQDPIGRGVLMHLIRQLNGALALTSVVVSHDIHEVEAIADYVYILGQGKVMGQGTPAEINASEVPQVREFVRGKTESLMRFHYPAPDYKEELDL